MSRSAAPSLPLEALRAAFGSGLQEQASLAGYTTAHAGGPADALLIAKSAGELEQIASRLWDLEVPFRVIGAGSNVLVSDSGLREVVVINRAKSIQVEVENDPPSVWAESGAHTGTIARQAALKGLVGFEWGATVPGTLGGAVYGNAGAFGGDIASCLVMAEILHPHGKENWPVDRFQYEYRSSILKRERMPAVILAARITLERGEPKAAQEKMSSFSARRRSTQPPGASMGSMFKNPPGDYAGRLIEAAGLKGARFGDAEISPIHANFFINHGNASSAEIGQLIRAARKAVAGQFGIELELEVELLGNWSTGANSGNSGAAARKNNRTGDE